MVLGPEQKEVKRMLGSRQTTPDKGIHLRLPAIAPVVAVPAGVAALIADEEKLSSEINRFKEASATLGEKALRLQGQRVAAERKGDRKLAKELLGEMQDILRRSAAIQHNTRRLEKERKELGWRVDAEKRHEVEQVGT